MAETETEKVYSRVSFKKFGSWSSNKSRCENQQNKSKDLESRSSALPPPSTAAAEKAQPSAMRNVSVSRKVSKISAASLDTAELKKASSTPLSSISPSIRQLTEKFSSNNSARNHGALSPGSNVAGKSTTLTRFKSRRGERSPSRNLFHEDSGYFQVTDTVLTESPTDTKVQQQTFYSGTDSVSGSDSDRNQQLIYTRKSAQGSSVGTGKRDYSQIDPSISDNNNCSETLNAEDYVFVSEAPACKSHRSYFPSHHGDPPVHIDLTNWPSVTKIRELFGDRHRKKHRSTSDAEDLKSADHLELFSSSKENSVSDRSDRQSPNSPTPEATSLSLSDRHRSRAASLGRERRHQGMDSAFHPDQHYSDKAEIEPASASISRSGMFLRVAQPSNTHRPHSPSSGREGPETCPSSLNSDPPPSVLAAGPTSPPRSSSRGLSSSCVCPSVEQQQSQGTGQPRDSLHSSHSFSRPVAPSSDRASARAAITARWRFSSGDEEEEYHRAGGRSAPSLGVSGSYLSRGKNGWWGGKVPRRSSGSEEDSPASLGPSRDTMRRRSLRKKKKNSEVAIATGRDNGESDDSDDEQTGMMEHLERHQQNTAATTEQAGSSRNRLGEPEGSRNNAAQRGRNYTPNQMVAQESYRRQYNSGGPGTSSPLTTPLTGVSRVSKVNISSFISSPGGSQTSSIYCSTETLKEDQASYANRMANTTTTTPGSVVGASSSMLSKTYHGNFTMYRSPSFGHGDNLSRAPVRVCPHLLPPVNPPSPATGDTRGVTREETTVFQRLISGGVVGDKDRNRMSMSNPDIASETMSLLSFLKSDLSELRVRKTDRSGVTEGSSAVYRMGSRGLHPGLRPSLKDLTATLRRAKSFTYSDKPEGMQHSDGSSAKRSSSEQRLDLDGERDGGRRVVPARDVESDGGDCRAGGYGDEEVMPTPLQDRYVQEARQVIRDICQMSARKDDDNEYDMLATDSTEDDGFKRKQVEEQETKEREGRAREAEVDIGAASISGEQEKREGECENRERVKCLQKGDSEENVFYDRFVDELSGHESSLTDEGIVTEPETGPGDPESLFVGSSLGSSLARDVLGQPLTVWKQSALHEEKWPELNEGMREGSGLYAGAGEKRENLVSVPALGTETESIDVVTEMSSVNNNSTSGRTNVSQSASAPGLEAPPTPSAIRRRRKFSSAGNTGSDSSNGSTGESNGDPTVYRSLSDPMPQRRHSVSEEGNNSFSVDSNLLGSLSLSSKGAGGVGGGSVPESSSAADLSECTGSVTSELSVCSDGGLRDDSLRDDYSNVIRSIVAEPGAMDRLMTDDKNNGKATKKKSFSDPSRRGDGHLLDESGFKSHHHPNEPISELDQLGQIPPSSSEPILSEQRDELWELGDERGRPLRSRPVNNEGGKLRSQSERELHSCLYGDDTDRGGGGQILNFDPELAEVLSPKMGRRASRKRPNRVAQTASEELDHSEPGPEDHGPEESQDQDQTELNLPLPPPPPKSKARSKHVRHASEPATFVPISPPPQPPPALLPASEPSILGQPTGVEAPSLEDVTKRYILALNAPGCEGEPSAPGSGGTVPVPDGFNSSPATPTGAREPRLQRKSSEELTTPAPQRAKPRVDMRRHVVMTLLDTEQSYVESLRTLIQGYMRPLKQPDSGSLVDPSLVDEMFYQIPEILEHHEHFLEQVTGCISQWHDKQTVGQLLIQSFSKEILANIYSAYIDNFLNAKDAVRIAKEAKPAFLKFLETSMRENKEKQALGDLMIKPVQRIPRYELLVKDLLKHTPEEHPDHPLLLDAQRDIKRLAEKINKGRRSAEEVERETRVMQEIEAHIEGVEHVRDILNPMRKFLRQEMVMEAKTVGGKKDRSLFLFSDLLICTTLKRKSGSLRRSSMSLYSAASVIDTSSKYKFLWKLPLEDVEIVKSPSQATNKETIQKIIGRLDEDLSTLGHISKLSETLSFPHQSLDDVIKDLMVSVHRELAEKQSLAFSMSFLPTKLELTTASAETSFVFEFSSPDTRSNFQQAFEDAKKQLAMNKDQWDPEFLKAIPIMKTRSGMQFSCASPSHSCPESSSEVWVCNSDGYVGQVCLLNIRDQPTVEACIAVCSARIICIAAVPGLKGRERGVDPFPAPPRVAVDSTPSQQQLHISISHSSLQLTEPPSGAGPELVPFDSDDTDDEDSPSPSSTLQSQASHSTVSSSYGNEEGSGSKDMATETTSSEEEQDYPEASPYGAPGRLGVGGRGRPHSESPMDGRAMRRSSRGSFTRASLEDLLSIDPEAYQSSVWLGTEDGCIHVYQSSDNIRNRKNSMKMQHSAPILCILYLDNKVFVSLANGEVIVYQREAGSFWDAQSSQTLSLGTPSSPVTKMVPVGGKLWCGSQNRVLIINTTTLVQEHWFQVGTDSSRCVTCMVSYGQGVWLALQGSAQIRLYHAQTWDSLTEVDVAPAVHKMLAGSDAIIRQHKAACLRITALLGCKDLLWIGTSAGVVLTLSIPAVSSGTVSGTLRSPLTPMGSAHGHTGHVRFLTSIELPEGFDVNFPLPTDTTAQSGVDGGNGGLQRRDSSHRRASALLPVKTNQLVISGGDGYEDFRLTNSSSETVGRDDSTNHLLLWRV
ncbi:rho guanine nucleotide exchange factor 17-like [Oncorhynchus keta]|uniref:rho guanine nucleotide exchange factor 17-like n=1 Tax=Oncorhynchus keta TaxID=8018 RepID=UPI00227B0645|nr:rho guanine nucleotide exchange factor 17-like [Oncorhynchus keta]XP_052324234.1 rho guanine nucleotide exchange factor 17-like [Oncorhynchus keta]XP_052324235.1 rho guanine nucleotide exchange factor 17-like [Oncorhynchus keta]XP_052324236.1 rho guanine nucleotide exchange factor 17-like [Oncorhynchus keta]